MPDATIDPFAAPVAGTTGSAPGRRCKVRRILDNYRNDGSDVTAERIEHLLHLDADDPAEPGWTDAALSRALAADGNYVAASMLSVHRSGSCICSTRKDPA